VTVLADTFVKNLIDQVAKNCTFPPAGRFFYGGKPSTLRLVTFAGHISVNLIDQAGKSAKPCVLDLPPAPGIVIFFER